MPRNRILILGGTTEAREAADALQVAGHDIVFSLAGVTVLPQLPQTPTRRGGFGGIEGLVLYLREQKIDAVLDATHPFAAIMSKQAYAACVETGIRLARLERPAWRPEIADKWISVSSLADAAMCLQAGARVLLTTGRKEIGAFTLQEGISGIVRTIGAPAESLPPHWQLIQDRPPFTLESEMALIKEHRITHIVSKNAGSSATRAKLDAARLLSLPVIMIDRPNKPQCRLFPDVKTLLEQQSQWLGST